MKSSWSFTVQRLKVIVLLWFNRHDEVLARLDAMAAQFPDARFPVATRAHLLAQLRRPHEAIEAHRRLVEIDDGDAAAWFNLGFLLEEQEAWDDALHAFERATAADPGLDRAWYGMGLVLIRLERLDEAVRAFKRNTELQPMSPYGWYQLARVQVDRHQPDEAAKIIRHLRGFEPKVAAQLERETGLIVGQPAS